MMICKRVTKMKKKEKKKPPFKLTSFKFCVTHCPGLSLLSLSISLSASEIKHFIATRIEVSFSDILIFRWTSNRTYKLAQTPSYKSALYVPLGFLSKNRDIFKILPNLTKVAPIHTPPYMFYTQSCFNTPPAKKASRIRNRQTSKI